MLLPHVHVTCMCVYVNVVACSEILLDRADRVFCINNDNDDNNNNNNNHNNNDNDNDEDDDDNNNNNIKILRIC